jgi:hypothetical protein
VRRSIRAFALGNHAAGWVVRSTGLVNDRPGMNEVSKNPLVRSITPLVSERGAQQLPHPRQQFFLSSGQTHRA